MLIATMLRVEAHRARRRTSPRLARGDASRRVRPSHLLDLIENFTLFSEKKSELIKILSQNHQVLSMNAAIQAMLEAETAKGMDAADRNDHPDDMHRAEDGQLPRQRQTNCCPDAVFGKAQGEPRQNRFELTFTSRGARRPDRSETHARRATRATPRCCTTAKMTMRLETVTNN